MSLTGDYGIHNNLSSASEDLITVEGKFSYVDGDTRASNPPAGSTPDLHNTFHAPAYNLKVEICGLSCSTGWTDTEGRYSITVKAQAGTVLDYTLSASNNAMDWYMDMEYVKESLVLTLEKTIPQLGPINASTGVGFNGSTFFAGSNTFKNSEIIHTVGKGWGTEMTIHFSLSGILNLTSVISIARDDVIDNRDPSEAGQTLGTLDLVYCDSSWPHFGNNNPLEYDEVHLPCYKINGAIPAEMQKWAGEGLALDAGLHDSVIAHEYYHHVQFEIAGWDIGGGNHT
jgi:hypothetical protein